MGVRDALTRSTVTPIRGALGMPKRRSHETAAIALLTAPELTVLAQIDRERPITPAGPARSQRLTPQAMVRPSPP